MTDRWRKRLGDLDKQSPSEDLFERAKGGPQLPDQPFSRPSTSTRVVTAIAAFVVFALAISVFAIPALRLKGGSGALGAPPSQLPLWPVRTLDAIQQLQAKEDDAPSYLSDPHKVVGEFGTSVMGWVDPQVHELSATAAGGFSSGSCCSSSDPSGGIAVAVPYQNGPSSAAAPPYRMFALTEGGCFGDSCPVELVMTYQPGRQGPGGVWMVLETQGSGLPYLDQGVGQTLGDGDSISASGYSLTSAFLGYHAGADDCSAVDSITGRWDYSGGNQPAPSATAGGYSSQLVVDLPPTPSCSLEEPGYVFTATLDTSSGSDPTQIDPLAGGLVLAELTAVPVTFEWPASEPTTSSQSGNVAVSWTTYSDPLGWTIDVPTTWVTLPIDGSDLNHTYEGAAFGSAQPQQYPAGPTSLGAAPGEVTLILSHAEGGRTAAPTDDSLFPLSIDGLAADEGGVAGPFEAGALRFDLSIRYSDLTAEQSAIIRRMVSSISFPTWHVGDTRNGWTAVGKVLLASSAEWLTFQGDRYFAAYGNGRKLFGPAPPCASGGGSYEVRETGVAGVSCLEGTGGDWDITTGEAQPQNSTQFKGALASYPAVRTSDGMLLVQFAQAGN